MMVRQVRETTWKRGAGIATLALAVFYTHASSYVLYAFTAGFVVVAMVLRERSGRLRRAALSLAALVPSAVAAAVWWHAGSLTHAGAQPGAWTACRSPNR